MTEKEARFFKTIQVTTLTIIVVIAFYFAWVTNHQNQLLADGARNAATRTGQVMGAFIDYATCVTTIPIEERIPENLQKCYDILRDADIPIHVPLPTK